MRVRDYNPSTAIVGTEKFYADNGTANVYVTANQIRNFTRQIVDIKRDYGAVGDGVTDDSAAFLAFTAAYQGERIQLYIPPGTYHFGDGLENFVFTGIEFVDVIAYGVTFNNPSSNINQGYFSFAIPRRLLNTANAGSTFVPEDDGDAYAALIQSTNIGDSSVTCVTHAHASRFAAGDWVFVNGLETLGFGDYSPYFYEYCQVASVNAGTGVVTFDNHLLYDGPYKSNFPSYTGDAPTFSGSTFTSGPAAIWLCNPGWAGEVHIRGAYFDNPFTYCHQRIVRYTDCSFKGQPLATRQQRCEIVNCHIGDGNGLRNDTRMELDKCIEHLIIRNSVFDAGILIQTADKHLIAENTDFGSEGVNGTCRFNSFVNCNISTLTAGPRALGVTESVYANNCRIGVINTHDSNRASSSGTDGTLKSHWTMSNGMLSRADNDTIAGFEVPGAHVVTWSNANQRWAANPFKLLNVRQTGANIQMDITNSDAEWAAASAGDRLIPHPCPDMTFRGCYGCSDAEDLSQAPPHTPMFGFSKRKYYNVFDMDADPMQVRGFIKEFRVNVIRAYTGTDNPETFAPNSAVFVASGSSPTLEFDSRTAGERVFTQYQSTGLKTTDNIANVVGAWLTKNIPDWGTTAFFSDENPSVWPQIEVTVIMDQGVLAPSIAGHAPFTVGNSSPITTFNGSADVPVVQLLGIDANTSGIGAVRFSNNANPPRWRLAKSRGTNIGSYTVVAADDQIGEIVFEGADGTDLTIAATIKALIDGAPGNNDMPGRIELGTTLDGASSQTTRMVIKNDGGVILGVNAGSPGAGNLLLGTASHAFANLPGTPATGMIAHVSDSNTIVFGATVAGGGANKVLAWYNGTNWTVLGI